MTDPASKYFTLVFEGDIRAFTKNPLKTETAFGTPLVASVGDIVAIRAAALEEAAKVAEDYDRGGAFAWMARDIAAAIRALKLPDEGSN